MIFFRLLRKADPLALLYNDQSVAENRSLSLAFSLFMADCNKDLRRVLFSSNIDNTSKDSRSEELDNYKYFRKLVIDLVLTTDIASPERVQIVKSKWTEAFAVDILPTATSSLMIVTSGVVSPKVTSLDNEKTTYTTLSENDMNEDPGDDDDNNIALQNVPPCSQQARRGSQAPKSTSLVEDFFNARASSITTISRSSTMALNEDTTERNNGPLLDLTDVNKDDDHEISTENAFHSQHHTHHHHPLFLSDTTIMNTSSKHFLDIDRHHRRFSLPNPFMNNKIHRFRLGICRALDLTGNPIEAFSYPNNVNEVDKKPSTAPSGNIIAHDRSSILQPFYTSSALKLVDGHTLLDTGTIDKALKQVNTELNHLNIILTSSLENYTIDDEPNDLKAQVVLEQLIKAADIASLMQRW